MNRAIKLLTITAAASAAIAAILYIGASLITGSLEIATWSSSSRALLFAAWVLFTIAAYCTADEAV